MNSLGSSQCMLSYLENRVHQFVEPSTVDSCAIFTFAEPICFAPEVVPPNYFHGKLQSQ